MPNKNKLSEKGQEILKSMQNERILFACECGGSHFFRVIHYPHDPDWAIIMEVIDEPGRYGVFGRIRRALKLLFGRDVYYAEVILGQDDAARFFEKVGEWQRQLMKKVTERNKQLEEARDAYKKAKERGFNKSS